MKANYSISEAVRREILFAPVSKSKKSSFKLYTNNDSAVDFVLYLRKLSFVLLSVGISIVFSLLIH